MNLDKSPFDDLSDFRPDPPTVKVGPNSTALAAVAEDQGFTINNFIEEVVPATRRGAKGPRMVLKTYRVTLSDANKFQKWMNANGYTHKEGFALLMKSLPD